MKNLIYMLFLSMAIMACNSSKKATEPNVSEAPVLQRDVPEEVIVYRLSVSFVSIGGGTDQKAREKYNQYMAEYEQKNKVKLSPEIAKWGREGEVDYCFKLTELSKKQQDVFVEETKEVLKSSSLVRYTENTTTCRP